MLRIEALSAGYSAIPVLSEVSIKVEAGGSNGNRIRSHRCPRRKQQRGSRCRELQERANR